MNRVSQSSVKVKKAYGDTSADVADDFDAIEQAVMATPRGRWFLAEYLRRRQGEELKRLLDSMRKLEKVAGGTGMPATAGSSLEGLRLLLAQAADELAHGLGEKAEPTLPEAAAGRLARLLESVRSNAAGDVAQAQRLLTLLTDVLHDLLARLVDMLGEPMPPHSHEDHEDHEDDGMSAGLAGRAQGMPSARRAVHEMSAMENKAPSEESRRQPGQADAAPRTPGQRGGQQRIVIHRHGHSTEIDIPLPENGGKSGPQASRARDGKLPDEEPAARRRPLVRIH